MTDTDTTSTEENNSFDLSAKLGEAFDVVLQKHYGNHIAPEAIVTPTGIVHLDALLGGGIVSSGPVLFTSTPETGKSTFAYQFSSIFQKAHKNSIIVYLDTEGAGNVTKSSKFRINRINAFGIDIKTFKYEPVVFTIMEVFECVERLIDVKNKFEEKTNQEIFLLFIWDSIPATRTSRTDESEDPNKIIGLTLAHIS